MRSRFQFWLVYSIAWLPFVASYVRLFTHLGRSFPEAIKISVFGAFPAALLGVGVVAICERFPWSRERRGRFLLVHLLSAVFYLVLWSAAVRILHAIDWKIEYGSWSGPGSPRTSFQVGFVTGPMIYATIAGIIYAIQAMEKLQAEEARVAQLEILRTRAELETLRAQLNPHFLFNTLHSLMALVRHDPKAAEDALEQLATLLRHTLMTTRETEDVALCDELDFIHNYLSLERLRLGGRLRVEEKIQPEALGCTLPPFSLQPLIENSIKHAIGTQADGGVLTIKAERHDGVLRLEVLDNGPGADPEGVVSSGGSGLRIARQRLMTRYKDHARFEIDTQPRLGFAVRMEIPVNESAKTST
jgi:signal transduction histidine kinase